MGMARLALGVGWLVIFAQPRPKSNRSGPFGNVLLKQFDDPLLLCFRFTRTGAAAPSVLNCEHHWRGAGLVLAPGVGATVR